MVQSQQEVLWLEIAVCQMEVELGLDIHQLAKINHLIHTLCILKDLLKPSSSTSQVKDSR